MPSVFIAAAPSYAPSGSNIKHLSIAPGTEDIGNLADRVWNLETSVSEISSMVKQMFEVMVSKKTSKKNKLRNY